MKTLVCNMLSGFQAQYAWEAIMLAYPLKSPTA